MPNVTQLKHLEHLEDEMLNYGVEGCKASVGFLQELRKMLGCDNSTGFMQTKWDGIPAVVCGINPRTGNFFIGTKSVFNKDEPKLASTENGIDMYYGHQPDLAEKLKICFKYLSKMEIKGVIQGDFLAAKSDIKTETVHGEKLYTFGNQALTYGIPVDHPIGLKIKSAEMVIVFHTHYKGDHVPTMNARAGTGETLKEIKEVALINNDTPMHKVGLDHQEEVKFDKHVSDIEKMGKTCGDFLDELVTKKGTTGDEKWHIASYVKQFFNAEIKAARSVSNIDKSLKVFIIFIMIRLKQCFQNLKLPILR